CCHGARRWFQPEDVPFRPLQRAIGKTFMQLAQVRHKPNLGPAGFSRRDSHIHVSDVKHHQRSID
ncbi:MAG: hypothetical protein ACK4OH_18020, partial [Acidovorax temperans]|uniref:hypothetical protein n=1 Tax=Acidovorax temperans TaxID=80878 RepID=UPI00391D1BF3